MSEFALQGSDVFQSEREGQLQREPDWLVYGRFGMAVYRTRWLDTDVQAESLPIKHDCSASFSNTLV